MLMTKLMADRDWDPVDLSEVAEGKKELPPAPTAGRFRDPASRFK